MGICIRHLDFAERLLVSFSLLLQHLFILTIFTIVYYFIFCAVWFCFQYIFYKSFSSFFSTFLTINTFYFSFLFIFNFLEQSSLFMTLFPSCFILLFIWIIFLWFYFIILSPITIRIIPLFSSRRKPHFPFYLFNFYFYFSYQTPKTSYWTQKVKSQKVFVGDFVQMITIGFWPISDQTY